MTELWTNEDPAAWTDALARYPAVVAAQEVSRLVDLDTWYREEFPATLAAHTPPTLAHEDLIAVTEWKMKRGVWRARNLVLVRGNDPTEVAVRGAEAFAALPDPRRPITRLTQLAGVGPATASAVLAAVSPAIFPFFDELIAEQIPGLGPVAFTAGYYARYAEQLRARAEVLNAKGGEWTAHAVGQALWANSGGKAVARA
jgi:hypothetical protein